MVPRRPTYDDLRSFDSYITNKEYIYSFKANILTETLALCVALLGNMNESVDNELSERKVWKERTKELVLLLKPVYDKSRELCDNVGDTADKPVSPK